MDNNTLGIYMHELRNLANYTESGFSLFNQGVTGGHAMAVLYSGQNILMAIGQVSGILWPTRARNRSRGEALRKVLALPEKHPLNDRRICEAGEAGDQKLDEWIAATRGKQIVMDLVGPTARVMQEQGLDESSIWRAYDPETRIFFYRGTAYNLEAIAKAMSDVGGRVIQVYQQMFPEQVEAERKAAEEAAKQAGAADQPAEG